MFKSDDEIDQQAHTVGMLIALVILLTILIVAKVFGIHLP